MRRWRSLGSAGAAVGWVLLGSLTALTLLGLVSGCSTAPQPGPRVSQPPAPVAAEEPVAEVDAAADAPTQPVSEPGEPAEEAQPEAIGDELPLLVLSRVAGPFAGSVTRPSDTAPTLRSAAYAENPAATSRSGLRLVAEFPGPLVSVVHRRSDRLDPHAVPRVAEGARNTYCIVSLKRSPIPTPPRTSVFSLRRGRP